jgi:triphosphoribosyl-dephospho-CoA synthase
MNSSRHSELEHLADALARGASMELYLTPKPGLVDLRDNGSHPDLSIPLMEQSIGIVADYLKAIVVSLRADEPFACQRDIAIHAERRLYDELGTNTHKGYIFLSGMLLIARHHAGISDEVAVRQSLSGISRSFFDTAARTGSNGERVRRNYHTGGIVSEAIGGYPSLFDAALPAFRNAFARHRCVTTASFAMMARLMQTVDDTTTQHRAGPEGLNRVRADGRSLEYLIAEGGDAIAFLEELNDRYKALNLTIGGVADMLGMAFGCLLARGEIGDDVPDRVSEAIENRQLLAA